MYIFKYYDVSNGMTGVPIFICTTDDILEADKAFEVATGKKSNARYITVTLSRT